MRHIRHPASRKGRRVSGHAEGEYCNYQRNYQRNERGNVRFCLYAHQHNEECRERNVAAKADRARLPATGSTTAWNIGFSLSNRGHSALAYAKIERPNTRDSNFSGAVNHQTANLGNKGAVFCKMRHKRIVNAVRRAGKTAMIALEQKNHRTKVRMVCLPIRKGLLRSALLWRTRYRAGCPLGRACERK